MSFWSSVTSLVETVKAVAQDLEHQVDVAVGVKPATPAPPVRAPLAAEPSKDEAASRASFNGGSAEVVIAPSCSVAISVSTE